MNTTTVVQGRKAVGFVAVDISRMWATIPEEEQGKLIASFWQAVTQICSSFLEWLVAKVQAFLARTGGAQVSPAV
jgi:hypothetical protein